MDERKMASLDDLKTANWWTNPLERLQAALTLDVAEILFPIGTIFEDFWHDSYRTYSAFLMLVDYRLATLPNGEERFGAILLRRCVAPRRMKFGFDCYRHSNPHLWLNAEDGYFTGCSKELMRVITPVIIKDQDGTDLETTFFLPSVEELHFNVNRRGDNWEESTWRFFMDVKWCLDYRRRLYGPSGKLGVPCWSRSEYPFYGNRWAFDEYGAPVSALPHDELFCAPACVIVGKAINKL